MKDKETAGILAIFLGVYGAHWFYIGNKTRAIIYLLITLFVVGIGSLIIFILSIVDGIRFLCMTDEAFEREIAEPQEERANYETSKRVAKKDISKYDELKKAHVLRRDGILTEEEFFTLKEKILEE